MSVTNEEIKKVARLARIRMDNSKISEIEGGFNKILDFVSQLVEVDCTKVDDSVQYVTSLHERRDVCLACDPSVMNNAPQKESNMFVVPKVVE
jgi:aspartyl-tRNA(Asn)/glutamyl-tRNA(Gln) amidotransferase subunit C